jgi:hypothetical protein
MTKMKGRYKEFDFTNITNKDIKRFMKEMERYMTNDHYT